MQFQFSEKALEDLKWFRYYYESVFPQGVKKAQKQYYLTKSLLRKNPYLGYSIDEEKTREFSIPKIPFSFIYRIKEDRIEVLRVWDERQDRMNLDTK